MKFRSKFHKDLGKYNPHALQYWQSFDKLPQYERRERVEATLNKLRRFSGDPIMQGIFGQAANSIKFRDVIDSGKILILKLSDIGSFNAAFIGAFTVFGIWQAAFSRTDIPEEERRTFHLYADEFQEYMTTLFPTMQKQGRKFGIDTMVAHQERGSLNDEMASSTLSVVNKVIFRINSDDASTLAPGFKTKGIAERVIERTKRSYPLNVLAHLATHGHSVPAFQEAYRKLRADIDDIVTSLLNIVHEIRPTRQNLNIPDIPPTAARSFVLEKKAQIEDEINRLLYACMLQKIDPVNVWAPLDSDPTKDAIYKILLELYIFAIRADNRGELFRKYSIAEMTKVAPEVNPAFVEVVRSEEKNLRHQVAVLGMDLSQEPCWIATGQYETVVEKARSVADLQTELANTLTTLDRYIAYCSLLEGDGIAEHIIRTEKPLSKTVATNKEVAREIYNRSRTTYGKDREQVDDELRRRLGGGDGEDEMGAASASPKPPKPSKPPTNNQAKQVEYDDDGPI